MNKFIESLKYVTLLFQINGNRIKYIKSVIAYKLTKHPKAITFPEMVIRLYNVKLIARKNTQDSAILSTLYERGLTKYLLNKKPSFFVDVGSHIGRFSILLAKNGSNVLAIEPSSSNYKQLYKNILFNNLNNIEILNMGCSNREGIGKLAMTKGYTGNNTFLERKGKNIEKVKLRKLDNLINKKMDNKDIIKIDVEGFEIRVLKGMEKILKTQSPIIITEILCDKDKKEINDFLNKFNYYNTKILDERNFVFEKVMEKTIFLKLK
ncbi:MAG: FkbM family methyltransferase [Candidatus Diapherotrites archaeon]